MDILLGGIPRSGTTAIARAIARHPKVFCWVSETGLLPYIAELSGDLPVNPEVADRLQAEMTRYLQSTITDMPAWNTERSQGDQQVNLRDEDVAALAATVTEIMLRQAPRADTLLACSEAMREVLARYASRPMIAEKTPSNALLFSEHADIASLWVMTHRDPFAVISSMEARVGADPWASDYAGEIERRIGLYNLHADQIRIASQYPDRAFVVGYDRLLRDQIGVAANLCCMLGIDPSRWFLFEVANIVGGDPRPDTWQKYSSLDRWKVLHLCGPYMAEFGYDEGYYGTTSAAMMRHMPQSIPSSVAPLYGAYPPSPDSKNLWMKPEAALAVYAPTAARTLKLKLYNRLDHIAGAEQALGEGDRSHRLDVYAAVNAVAPRCVAWLEFTPSEVQYLTIDLSTIEPLATHADYCLYRLTLWANFSYTPFMLLTDNDDLRKLSYMISGWEIV